MSLLANQYRTQVSGTTTTGALLSADFGFDANYVRVANDGVVPLRLTLTSSVATTADAEVRPGDAVVWTGGLTHVLGLATTSTSTDGTDWRRARVLATGG